MPRPVKASVSVEGNMQTPPVRSAAVTGASGFIGGHLVQRLLHIGCKVNAVVRDPSSPSVAHLRHLLSLHPDSLVFSHVSNLCVPSESLRLALRDTAVVFHVANPIGPSSEMLDDDACVDISVRSVDTVMRAAKDAGASRFVLTSSMAAVCGSQTERDPKYIFTETDWNDAPGSKYSRAKTRAEQRAWSLVKELSPMELSVVLPSLVLGPPLAFQPPRSSNARLYALASGDAKREGLRPTATGVVHIEDVVDAHIAAAENPGAVGKRFIASLPDQYTSLEVAACVSKHFPTLDVPTDYVGEAKDAPRISQRKPSMCNAKLEKLLGRPLRSIDDIIVSGVREMNRMGYLPLPSSR